MHLKKFDPYDFSKKIIDGVPVYYKNFSNSPCIHIRVCFGTGSIHDPKELAGLSHFLEHMIFDGSKSLPNKKAITEWSKLYALNSWNAWTFFTNTTYHLRCLPENLSKVLDGMADMIFHPLLKKSDIEHERKVITQEAWGVYKNEKYLTYCKEVLENSYTGSLRANTYSPLGWPKSISKISQKDVVNWHKSKYGKGNFFMVISGIVGEKEIRKLESFIKKLPRVDSPIYTFGELNSPHKLSITKTADEIGDPREQAEISFDRVTPTNSAPSEEIQLMSSALLQDILFERLRTERALCYGVSSASYIQRDFVLWNTNVKTKEENVDVIKKEFWKAIKDIISGKEKTRFNTLKKVRVDRLKSMEEITASTTDEVLSNLWRFGQIVTKQSMLDERKKVTYNDVASCLKEAFKKEWTVTEVILPSKK